MMLRRRGVAMMRYGVPGEMLARASGGSPGGLMVGRGRAVRVSQWERGLLFRNGRLERVLEPGGHRFWGGGAAVRLVDMRPWVIALPAQEVPTADGVSIKVTVAGHARVTDPVTYVTATRDPEQSLYLAVQLTLRDLLASVTFEDLLASRGGFADRLAAEVGGLDQIGIAIERLAIKDVMLPGELKRARAEVLVARAQGIAALERARGETAALRSLANAARLAAGNPALLQLRLLQQLATSAGHTVIFGTPPAPPFGQVLASTSEPEETPGGAFAG